MCISHEYVSSVVLNVGSTEHKGSVEQGLGFSNTLLSSINQTSIGYLCPKTETFIPLNIFFLINSFFNIMCLRLDKGSITFESVKGLHKKD